MEKGFGTKPPSFLNHGLEQQVEIIFKVIDANLPKAKDKAFELLSLLSSSLMHCTDFKFIDDFVHLLKVKNFLRYLAPFVSNNKEVTWQVLTVATKFRVMEKFMLSAVSSEGKIPGSLSGTAETVPPKQESLNLRHKFSFVLKQ